MFRLRAMLLALALAAALAAPARAASFDCSKARAPDEIAICRTPALSLQDTEMAALFFAYGKVPMMMGSNGARHDDAVQFLARRSACGAGIACLRQAYAARIGVLKAGITEAMQQMFDLQNNPPPCPGKP